MLLLGYPHVSNQKLTGIVGLVDIWDFTRGTIDR
jgi:hypothetical protein